MGAQCCESKHNLNQNKNPENKINNSYNPTMIQNIKPPVNQEIKQDINQNINQIANQKQSYNPTQNNDILEDPGNEQGGLKMTSSINNSNSREMSLHSSIIKKGATPNPETPGFIPNFTLKSSFKGHNKIIVSMIELENKKIATGSYDYSIKIWDLSTQNCELVINEEGRVFSLLEFEPNLILSAIDKTPDNVQDINLINPDDIMINSWDLNNPDKSLFSFKGHQLRVNSLVKCDDKFFASCSNDGDIIIWDYHLKRSVGFLKGHMDCILCMIKLNDGRLCSGSADKKIKIWDWKNQNCLSTLKGNDNWIKCLCQLNNDNGYIISGSQDNLIKVWDSNHCIQNLEGHNRSVRSICQIDNYNYIATASFDHTIKIWDLNKFECIQTLSGHNSSVINVIYHSDGYLVSCSNDLTIKIWKNN